MNFMHACMIMEHANTDTNAGFYQFCDADIKDNAIY